MIVIAEARDKTNALYSRVWEVISDLARWHEWNDTLNYIRFKERFTVGSEGLIRPRQGPESIITLHAFKEGELCAYSVRMLLTNLIVSCSMKQEPDGVLVSYKVMLDGHLDWFYYILISRRMKREAQEVVGKIGIRALQLEQRDRELEKDIAAGRYDDKKQLEIDWPALFAALEESAKERERVMDKNNKANAKKHERARNRNNDDDYYD